MEFLLHPELAGNSRMLSKQKQNNSRPFNALVLIYSNYSNYCNQVGKFTFRVQNSTLGVTLDGASASLLLLIQAFWFTFTLSNSGLVTFLDLDV